MKCQLFLIKWDAHTHIIPLFNDNIQYWWGWSGYRHSDGADVGVNWTDWFESTIEHYVPQFFAVILPLNLVMIFLGLSPRK